MKFSELKKEDYNKFNNLIKQSDKAIKIFTETGNRIPFISLKDQIIAFENEIKMKIRRINNGNN